MLVRPVNHGNSRYDVTIQVVVQKATSSVFRATAVPELRKNRIDCTVDRSSDKRRKRGVKRKLETLEDCKNLLLSLVGMLRDSGDRSVLQLLDLIRSNASLAELKLYIDDQRAEPDCKKKTSQVFGACNGIGMRIFESVGTAAVW